MRHCLIWQWLHEVLAPGYSLWELAKHFKKHNKVGPWRLAWWKMLFNNIFEKSWRRRTSTGAVRLRWLFAPNVGRIMARTPMLLFGFPNAVYAAPIRFKSKLLNPGIFQWNPFVWLLNHLKPHCLPVKFIRWAWVKTYGIIISMIAIHNNHQLFWCLPMYYSFDP